MAASTLHPLLQALLRWQMTFPGRGHFRVAKHLTNPTATPGLICHLESLLLCCLQPLCFWDFSSRLATECSLRGGKRPEPFSGLLLNSGHQPEEKGQEWTQASAYTLSFTPPLPAGEPQTSSAAGWAMGNHSERLVLPRLLPAATTPICSCWALTPGLNAAGTAPEAGNLSTTCMRRNDVLTRTGAVSPPQSAWHCKLLTIKPENRRSSCVPKTIPSSLWKETNWFQSTMSQEAGI